MKMDKKMIVMLSCIVWWVIIILLVVWLIFRWRHPRGFEWRGFACGIQWNFEWKWKQNEMMSGVQNVIANKDYAWFQKLFSGSNMLKQIDTQEKFNLRVDLNNTQQKVKEIVAQLWSGNDGKNFMMFGPGFGDEKQGGRWMMWRRWWEWWCWWWGK